MQALRAAAAALLLLGASSPAYTHHDGKIDVPATWVAQNYVWVIDQLMPLPKAGGDDQWVFSVRVTPSWEQEYLVSVRKTFTEKLSLAIAIADGEDLAKQAQTIVTAHPGISRQRVLKRLRVRRRELGGKCAGLPELVEAVERLSLPAIPSGDLVVDGVGYEFLSSTNSGGELRGEFGSGYESLSAVARWARHAREVAEGCPAAR